MPADRKPSLRITKINVAERIIETLIRITAFTAIAAIVLIFIFVFREASPLFFGSKPVNTEEHSSTSASPNSASPSGSTLEQEVYDPLAEESDSKPGATTAPSSGTIQQEVYDPLAEEPKSKSSAPASGTIEQEVYDPLATESEQSSEKTGDAPAIIAPAPPIKTEPVDASATLRNLGGDTWQPVSTVPKYGLWPLFVGTVKVTLIAVLFAAPIAILAALFTSAFAPRWAREVVKPTIELLAGFPSVVIGFFALIVMATVFQDLFGYPFRLNALLGGIAMSFAVIPIIYTISEDALVSVPATLKEASDALGATKWQTAYRVVLPAAVPGVFAAVVLGFGRAFGETMIALMATGNAPLASINVLEPVRTFSATIGAEMAEVVFGDEHYNVLFFIGALLFIFTFTMNAVVEFWVRKRLLRKIQGN